jgi:hypothetical protein
MLAGSDYLFKAQFDYFYFVMASDWTLDFGKHQSGIVVDIRSNTYVRTSFLLQTNDRVEHVDNFLFGVR